MGTHTFKCIIIFFLLCSVNTQAKLFATEQVDTVKIAVRALSGVVAATDKWTATAEYLSDAIEGYTFLIKPVISLDEMHDVIEKGEVNFVLTNPTAYIDLSVNYGVARLVTLINMTERGGFPEYGGVIFTRADRDDINEFNDLVGKSIMGVHLESFGGWRMAYRELIEVGIEPFEDCSEVLFSPNSLQKEVVRHVLQKQVDIGAIRTGILENMVASGDIDRGDFKIIGLLNDDFPLLHSNRLYPEWPFASLQHTNDLLEQRVTIALLQMKPEDLAAHEGGYTGWRIPLSYHEVLALLKDLKIEPFNVQHDVSILGFVKLYWSWFILTVLAVLLLLWVILYIARINARLRVTQENLEQKFTQGEDRNEAILASVPDIIMEVDDQHVYTWANKAGFEFFGNDVIGKEAQSYFEGEQNTYKIVEPIFRGITENLIYIESWQLRKDGEKRLLAWWCQPLKSNEGQIGAISSARDITENRLAEDQLRESQIFNQTLLETSPDIIYVYDIVEKKNKYSNQGIEKILGYSVAEIQSLGANMLITLMHPDDFEDYVEKILPRYQQLQDKEVLTHEYRMKHKKGSWRWLRSKESIFLRGDEGSPEQIFGLISEITDRKHAEEKLLSSEERFKIIFDEAPEAYYLSDLKGSFIDGNKAAEKIMGFKKEELIGKSFLKLKLITPADLPRAVKLMARNVRGKSTGAEEFTLIRKDLNKIQVEISTHPVKIRGKTLVLGIARDITERKRFEKEVINSRQRFKILADYAYDWEYLLGENTQNNYHSSACERITGYTAEEFLKDPEIITRITREDHRSSVIEHFKSEKNQDSLVHKLEFPILHRNGSEIWVEHNCNPVYDEDGEYLGRRGNNRDITNRKQAELRISAALLEAEQANEVKDQFIANISHEIRTPLNSILGFSDLLGKKFAEEASATDQTIFSYIKLATNRLMHTVDAILNLSQLNAGSLRLHPQKLNLSELVVSTIQELKLSANEKKLELGSEGTDQDIMVFADEYSIQQALLNLTENAIKYTHAGSIQLKLEQQNDHVVLTIIDTGIGISEENQERIFEPYTQESEGYTKKYQGIGLGLALTRQYLKLNHVTLILSSHKDVGSTFTLTFPKIEDQAHG